VTIDTHHAGVATGDLQRLPWISVSYCSQTQRLRGIVGRAEQVEQRLAVILGFLDIGDIERRQTADLAPFAVIFRGFIAQFLDRQVGDLVALVQDAEPRSSVVLPTMAKSRPHLTKIALAPLPSRGSSTMSMRSWLSDSIIS
jgi:hypothetical protein